MLNKEELQQITEALIAARKEEVSDFHIGAEEHYNQHKRIDRLLDVFDQAESLALKAIIGLFIVGGLLIAAIGAGFHPK